MSLLARLDQGRQSIIQRKALTSVWNQGGLWGPFFGPILESFTGAWQTNTVVANQQTLLSFSAVFACVTGIASDIAKLRIKLVEEDEDGIWTEIKKGSPFLPVLRRPNHYQTRIKFIEQWLISKLLHGNTYVLKQRDNRRMVNRLYVLHPTLVKVMVADDGSVFYELKRDDLSQTQEIEGVDQEGRVLIPASEIIHDTAVSLWHPLIGVSPLYGCAMGATLGAKIFENSSNFFANQSLPGGILTAPGEIHDDTATRLKTAFEENFGGDNRGKLAVLGDGLKFEPMRMTAEAAQQVEQLQMAVEDVARAFRYPLHKLNGQAPPYAGSVEASQVSYYTDCLHNLIETLEALLDEGLGLPEGKGTELDVESLLRMDTVTQIEAIDKARNTMTPNEGRHKLNLPPVKGGDVVLRQQQDFSLEAIAKRDAKEDPFASSKPPSPKPPETETPTPPSDEKAIAPEVLEWMAETELRKELCLS